MREAELGELAMHIRNIFLRGNARVLPGLHRILLGGKAESVITHGVQDVFTLHAVITSHGISCDISKRVAHVQALPRRVWEHIGDIELRVVRRVSGELPYRVVRVERAFLLPIFLPAVFDIVCQFRRVAIRRAGFNAQFSSPLSSIPLRDFHCGPVYRP